MLSVCRKKNHQARTSEWKINSVKKKVWEMYQRPCQEYELPLHSLKNKNKVKNYIGAYRICFPQALSSLWVTLWQWVQGHGDMWKTHRHGWGPNSWALWEEGAERSFGGKRTLQDNKPFSIILSPQWNANENDVGIPSHSRWNDHHQESKWQWMLWRIQGKTGTLGWSISWSSHHGNQRGSSSKWKHIHHVNKLCQSRG